MDRSAPSWKGQGSAMSSTSSSTPRSSAWRSPIRASSAWLWSGRRSLPTRRSTSAISTRSTCSARARPGFALSSSIRAATGASGTATALPTSTLPLTSCSSRSERSRHERNEARAAPASRGRPRRPGPARHGGGGRLDGGHRPDPSTPARSRARGGRMARQAFAGGAHGGDPAAAARLRDDDGRGRLSLYRDVLGRGGRELGLRGPHARGAAQGVGAGAGAAARVSRERGELPSQDDAAADGGGDQEEGTRALQAGDRWAAGGVDDG